jgi:membrane protein DedA with SNARE-associated domain
MVPMVRSLISIPAGPAKMNPIRFTRFTVMGTACWSLGLAFACRLLGENWVLINQVLSQYELVIAIFLGLVLIAFIKRRIKKSIIQKSAA